MNCNNKYMNILGIDTTGKIGSVCVVKSGKVYENFMQEPMNHLKLLADIIDKTCKESELTIGDIDLIAVSKGPGSFTGIRIGVSTARGIGQILGIPIVGVPTLESFVYNKEIEGELCCPLLDARRNQVYGGAYTKSEVLIPEGCYMIDEYLSALVKKLEKEKIEGKINFYGDGIKFGDFIKEAFAEHEGNYEIFEDDRAGAMASSIAKLGEKMAEKGEAKEYSLILPEYLRKAEAERKLELKKQQEV